MKINKNLIQILTYLPLLIACELFIYTRHSFLSLEPLKLLAKGIWSDDSFYYLRIAENYLNSGLFTLDNMNLTNGFHPIFMLISILCVEISQFDRILPIVFTNYITAVLTLLSALIIYRISNKVIKNKVYTGFILIMFVTSPYVLLHGQNGLETSLSLLFSLIFVLYVLDFFLCSNSEIPAYKYIGLGIISGLLVLARVDNVLLIAAVTLALLVKRWKNEKLITCKDVVSFGAFILVMCPWYVYSYINIGLIFPQSGEASSYVAKILYLKEQHKLLLEFGDYLYFYAIYLINFVFDIILFVPARFNMPFFAFPPDEEIFNQLKEFLNLSKISMSLIVIFLGLIITYLSAIKVYYSKPSLLRNFALIVIIYFIIHSLAYSILVPVLWYFPRYQFSLSILLFLAMVFWLFQFKAKVIQVFIIGLFCLVSLIQFNMMQDMFTGVRTVRSLGDYLTAATRIKQTLEPTNKIGSFQPGTISWFTQYNIINLDGKVNNQALQHIKKKQLSNYVTQESIEYIVDLFSLMDAYFSRDIKVKFGVTDITENPEDRMHIYKINKK